MALLYADKTYYDRLKALWKILFKDTDEFIEYYFTNKVLDNKILIYEQNNQLTTMLHMNPYRISIYDKIEDIHYIVGVGTEPSYQRQGYMKTVMEKALNDLYKFGNMFTFLMPVDERYYSSFGFSFVEDQNLFSTVYSELPIECKYNFQVKTIKNIDIDDLVNFYQSNMNKNYDSYIERDKSVFERLIKELLSENGNILGCYQYDKLKGYLIYYLNDNCEVREIIYFEFKVLEFMLYYLRKYDKFKNITITTYNNDLQVLLPYTKNRRWVINQSIMIRMLNIQKFVNEYIRSSEDVSFIVKINDTYIKKNKGVFRWNVNMNEAQMLQVQEEPDIELDISVLTKWLFGYMKIERLIYLYKEINVYNLNVINLMNKIRCIERLFINEIV